MGYCNIVEILINKRESLGLSRREACELCPDMISEKTLYRIEKGYIEVSKHSRLALDKAYNNRKERFLQFSNAKGSNVFSEGMECLVECRYSEAISAFNYALSHVEIAEERKYIELLISLANAMKENREISVEEIECFEKNVLAEFPLNLQDDRWPLMDFQTDKIVLLLNLYKKNRIYDKQEKLAKAIIKSISLKYLENDEFASLFCIAERAIVNAMQDAGKHREAIEEAINAIPEVCKTGDISSTYHIIYSLIWSVQQLSYFGDEQIKNACISDLRNIILLSEICDNSRDYYFYSKKKELIN